MNTADLKAWAVRHADGPVIAASDRRNSVTSRLIRFHWNDGLCVAVGADIDGATRINAVLDALALFAAGPDTVDRIHLMLGLEPDTGRVTSSREHLDAIGTLVTSVVDGPPIHVWTISPSGQLSERVVTATAFTTSTPDKWAKMLLAAATARVDGMAATLVNALRDVPEFALYPKLSAAGVAQPWQMRLDGLEIGRTGPAATTLALASSDITRPGEPRTTWCKVVGAEPLHATSDRIDELVAMIRQLVSRWTNHDAPHSLLAHGQAEHALEAHILSGRLTLTADNTELRPAAPYLGGVLGAAQFPTLWGDVTRPARYLDALLADGSGQPWAIELKDPGPGRRYGSYLRHGISQAVLYRHYIRHVESLDPWFAHHGLTRAACRAALAFPAAPPAARPAIDRHRHLASLYNVEIIEFPLP
jgi:hypothetical protein